MGAALSDYIVSRFNSGKQLEKKNKDEESVIEQISKDVASHCEEKYYKHHEPSNANSTSIFDAATQTEDQHDPMVSDQQDRMESVRGLQNLGNTCYFNSTMQALVHTNLVFREELENLRKKGEFVRIVLEFFSSMQHENARPYSPNRFRILDFFSFKEPTNSRPYSPDNLHRMFGKKSPKFADYRQHDSHECLRNFLDNVRKEERDNSGAVDKRKVLTVVDSVFGGHFITVYICKECETPYHVCEALLDISLPIMIDEKDLAAMNSARGSNRKESMTVKLQNPKSQTKHYASQIDDPTERKLNKSPIDILTPAEQGYKSTSVDVDNAIELKPSETKHYSRFDVALQQKTSDEASELKSKTETNDRHSTDFYAQPVAMGYEFDVSVVSKEPEACPIREEDKPADEKLHILNNMVNVAPTNAELENASGWEIVETFTDNSLTNPRMVYPDTKSETFSLDDKDKDAEESKTTFGTETDLGEVYQAKEPDTPKENNKISDEDNEFRHVSESEKLDENVENSCSSTKAGSNLEEQNDPNYEPRRTTEDNKESADHEWSKSGARDNPTEIQKCNEGQERSSEEQQHKEREEQHQDEKHQSDHTKLVLEQCNTEEKEGVQDSHNTELVKEQHKNGDKDGGQLFHNTELVQEQSFIEEKDGEQHSNNIELGQEERKTQETEGGQHYCNAEPHQIIHNIPEREGGQDFQNAEKDQQHHDIQEKRGEHLKNLEVDEKQSDEKHLFNVQHETQHKGAEEQQDGQLIRNTEPKEVGEENKVEQEEHVQRVDEQEQQQELEDEERQEQNEQDTEQAQQKYHTEEEKVVEKKKEEDDEDQTQELGEGEFEVLDYATEIRDLYRETVEKLMTPLSLSSPYLPNNDSAISKQVSIDNCLMYFTRKEHINNEYLCDDCYGKHLANGGEDVMLTSATKQTMIFNPPAILTLHLKRFELKPGGSVKRTDMITYGELLDIAPYCSSMCLRNDPPCQNFWYSLYGVVVHHGSTLKSGHYMAYVKIKDNDAGFKKFLQEKYFDRDLTREQLIEMMQEKQPGGTHKRSGATWYCMNDSWCDEVPVAKVLNQEAYLLFYERMS